MAYLNLTLAHSTGDGQGHAHFDSEYIGNSDIWVNNYYSHKIGSRVYAFY